MEILASAAALSRIGARVRAIAPEAGITALGPDGVFRRDGAPVDAAAPAPDVAYVSLDLYPAGLLPPMFARLLAAPAGGFAQLFVAGLDDPVFARLMAAGWTLARSVAQAPAIADYVLAHGLALLHPIEAQRRAMAEKAWRIVPFREVGSSTWLLVGYGAIGEAVAQRLAPFGARILASRRQPEAGPLVERTVPPAGLRDVLPEADVVVLACALTPETRGLADAGFFAAMKPGAILINVARGPIVDEAALREGLARDRPAHAVLDVFAAEPLPADSWIWSHPKVVATAHGSNAGDQVLARGDARFLENLARVRRGEAPLGAADPGEAGHGGDWRRGEPAAAARR